MKNILVLVLFLFAMPLAAQSTDVTVWLTSQMNDEGGRLASDDDVTVRFDSGSGYGVSLGRTFGSHLSGELAIFRTSSSANLQDLADLGDVELTPITAMLRYHFLPGRTVDVYVGGGIAHVMTANLDSADLRLAGIAPVRLEDKTGGVIGAGVTFTFTQRWGLAVDARYIPLELAGRAAGDTETLKADLNPLLLSAGLRIRF